MPLCGHLLLRIHPLPLLLQIYSGRPPLYYLQNIYSARSICAVSLDAACVLLAFAGAWFVVDPQVSGLAFATTAFASVGVICGAIFFSDGYQPATIGSSQKTTTSILETMGLGLASAILLYFGISVPGDVIPTLATVAAIAFPLLIVERMLFRLTLGADLFTSKILVIGATNLGIRIAELLQERRDTGIHFIGFLSDSVGAQEHCAQLGDFPVIGKVHQLEKVLVDRRVDCIVVASKDRDEHFPEMILMKAKMKGIRVESGVSFLERLSGHVFPRDLQMSYLIFGERLSRGWSYRTMQRSIDLVGASFLFVLALPVLTLVALAIKLESPGPVLYRQRRLGKDDKPFMMNKLRSMREDAESESGAVFTSDGDDRITRVGYFTRRTRLDELPQLWNVLRGEMSLVGPRAERPEFVELLSDRYPLYFLRTSVRPGITGWAQTRFGYVNNVEAYEDKLALDLYYLKYRSTLLDLIILVQTIKTVLLFRGM
jgi:exopolysaccharide biosynthesis polyprenyl glycosylphosphotransferase